MKKSFTKIMVAVMIITAAGAYSCKNRGESKKQAESSMLEKEVLENKLEENVYPLPTSAEVIKQLSDLDLGYIVGVTNPSFNAKKYVTSYSRSVNLGIYGGDLSYVTVYNLQQDVINYLDAMRTLANDLNLAKIYDETLYEKIRNNFDNRDTLVVILTEAFDRTYAHMVDAGQANIAMLMIGGAWLEGMYLTLAVSESGAHLTGFEQVLIDQKKSFDIFMEIAQPHADDALVVKMMQDLQPIKDIYSTLTTSLTMQNIQDLKMAVDKVRSELVK
ncbi:MAG: hypothetical protein MUC78_06185 [Bacteroidales bacterium]|jgi:hypothetical protein|nr:hypothetical protein [Bacteroidales bacterium]